VSSTAQGQQQRVAGEEARSVAIREACGHGLAGAAPDAIWDELAAKGIDATPGEVCGAVRELLDSGAEPPAPAATGLTAEDLETLAALAAKAGGVEQLRHYLAALERLPK
jgi:hypothetical protein